MAEEPIRKEEIIDLEGAQQSVNDFIKALEDLSSVMHKDLKISAEEWLKSLQGINISLKENQELVARASVAAENLAAQDKEMSKIDKELIQLKARKNVLDSEEANEVVRLKVAIENTNKAKKDAARLDDSAEGSVNKMRAELKELTAEYNKLAPQVRDKAAPAIKKLTDELKKAESAIGNNTRNVGNYRQSIISTVKDVLGFAGATGTAVVVLNKLKEAFLSTDQGMGVMRTWAVSSKAFIQNLSKGWGEAVTQAIIAGKISKQTQAVIIEDRKDLVEIAKMESEIAILRYKSADATLSETEQLNNLNLAQKKENDLIEYKIKDKNQELADINMQLTTALDDTTLLNRRAQVEADIETIKGQRSLRIETKASALREKQKKRTEEEITEAKLLAEKTMGAVSMMSLAKIKGFEDAQIEIDKKQAEGLIKNEAFYAAQKKQIDALNAYELQSIIDADTKKRMILDASFQAISNALNALSSLYENQKQRELSSVGDNAAKREEIEKKYAKKQQNLSIGVALINGAVAITEIWRKWAADPIIAGILTGVQVAMTGLQVGIIASQKFAKGGSGIIEGASHAGGGVQIAGVGEAEGGEHFSVTSRAMTNKYGSRMLDAVSNSINQGKFFEVWSNVNKNMTGDPYTKKMYELMKSTPVVYPDTDGCMVKEYPDGRKFVIKPFNRN